MSSIEKQHDKYIVWKMEDLLVLFREENILRYFGCISDAVRVLRESKGKGENKYIVCNQDEPYADQVWQAILDGETAKLEANDEK